MMLDRPPARNVTSWGRVLWPLQQLVTLPGADADLARVAAATPLPLLPRGNGRSYGDSNLNPDGVLLDTRRLDRILGLDPSTGVLTCEAGVLLSDVLAYCVPRGWFPVVVPGTQFITVGGAIANDVHGKNHHRAGSFGDQVVDFELVRSDGSRRTCSREENPEWFGATIGGLGLTGLVTRARIRLRPVAGPWIDAQTLRFRSLDEFFGLSEASEASHEYTAAWIDCASSGKRLGRGVFERGNHADATARAAAGRDVRMPFTPPFSLVNPLTLKAFNLAYFHVRGERVRALKPYRPFLFPLDRILEWNRMYGPRGFYQYQCVVPPMRAAATVRALLDTIAASGMGSFLAVLKQFGSQPGAGMLSFPTAGTTLALDFPNRGARLHALFEALDRIVADAGGRLYPAKDGRMAPALFRAGFPRWREFAGYVDPRFSSGFWRRVNA